MIDTIDIGLSIEHSAERQLRRLNFSKAFDRTGMSPLNRTFSRKAIETSK